MNNILVLISLFYFSVSFGQENEFCRLSKEHLDDLCEDFIKKSNRNETKQTEVIFYVTAKSAKQLQLIQEWANKKGYLTEPAENTNADTAIALKKKIDVFSCNVYAIIYKDIEQELNKMSVGCFAVKIDTCEGRSPKEIIKFYNNFIATKDINSQTYYFHQFVSFDFGKEQKIPELTQWARANGYKTKESILEYTSPSTGKLMKFTDLTFEKKLGHWNIDYFIKEVNKTTEAMIQFKIPQCLNTGMGISGNSKTD